MEFGNHESEAINIEDFLVSGFYNAQEFPNWRCEKGGMAI